MSKQHDDISINNELPIRKLDATRIKMHLDTLKQIFSAIICHEYYMILCLIDTSSLSCKTMKKIADSKLTVSQIKNKLAESAAQNNVQVQKAVQEHNTIEQSGRKELIKLISKTSSISLPQLYEHAMKEVVERIAGDIKKVDAAVCYHRQKLTMVNMQHEIFKYLDDKSSFIFPAFKIVEYFEKAKMPELYSDNTYVFSPLSQHFRNAITIQHAKEVLDEYILSVYKYVENLGESSHSSMELYGSDIAEVQNNDYSTVQSTRDNTSISIRHSQSQNDREFQMNTSISSRIDKDHIYAIPWQYSYTEVKKNAIQAESMQQVFVQHTLVEPQVDNTSCSSIASEIVGTLGVNDDYNGLCSEG